MPRIKLHLSIGYAGASRESEEEIDDELWESLNDEEKEKLLNEIASDWASNYIEYSTEVMD